MKRRLYRRLSLEQLERREVLSVTFAGHVTISDEVDDTWSLHAADVDGDGDIDVLSASRLDNKVAWYENTDGKGAFGKQETIGTADVDYSAAHAADIDGDGDIDILLATLHFGLVWYENLDGKGSFGEQLRVGFAGHQDRPYAADVDGDGYMDVLSGGWDSIVWFENIDGTGQFGEPQLIIGRARADIGDSISPIRTSFFTDLDGDDDVDVIWAGTKCLRADDGELDCEDGRIWWHENSNGNEMFGEQELLVGEFSLISSVYAADFDNDDDMDLLYAADNTIAWRENIGGKGQFGAEQVVATKTADRIRSTVAVDMDGDSDLDILFATSSEIGWYENIDGKGGFATVRSIVGANGITSIHAVDLDQDGDMDVLWSEFELIRWAENLSGEVLPGDANRDFTFDQQDIVQILQSAKFLTSQPATWEEGDWNADEVFDVLDVVVALQTGNYMQGPYAARADGEALLVKSASDKSGTDELDALFAAED